MADLRFAGRARAWRAAAGGVVLVVAAVAAVVFLNLRGDHHSGRAAPADAIGAHQQAVDPARQAQSLVSADEQVKRGAALARIGHCAGCHTAPGGADYAGGRGIVTPFGTVQAGNLTPDPEHGLGRWSADDFWRALHNGRSRNGRLLYPAFPYENTTHISREDSDALYAYLQSLPAVAQPNLPHTLSWPASSPWALALWRALYFRPAEQPLASLSTAGGGDALPQTVPDLKRGESLVRGLGHCSACHAPRNSLGAQAGTDRLSGAHSVDGRAWAPALPPTDHEGTPTWNADALVAYLKTGRSLHGSALGTMATVVAGSTQHMDERDLRDMAAWLLSQARPGSVQSPATAVQAAPQGVMELGQAVYADHCAACHGDRGQGAIDAYPPLAGNPRVMREPATNLVRIILEGGFAPATAAHPQPYGMPPYAQTLNDGEIAAVATYIRQAWSNRASPVTPLAVQKQR